MFFKIFPFLHKAFCKGNFLKPTTLTMRLVSWFMSLWCKCEFIEEIETRNVDFPYMWPWEEDDDDKTVTDTTEKGNCPFDGLLPAYIESPFGAIISGELDAQIIALQTQARLYLQRRRAQLWFSKSDRNEVVIRLVLHHLRDADYDRYPNVINLQARCRQYLVQRRVNAERYEIKRICWLNQFDLPEALVAHLRGMAARSSYRNLVVMHKAKALTNTAFPRLGLHDLDGCDCWLQCFGSSLPPSLLAQLFGVSYKAVQVIPIVGQHPTYLLRKCHNEKNLVLVKLDDTFFLYEVFDCHQIEGVSGWLDGHAAVEAIVLRVNHQEPGEYNVLKYHPVAGIMNQTDYLEDQHQHLTFSRSKISRSEPSIVDKTDLVYMGSELVPREVKAFRRAERRKQNAILRQQGIKVAKVQLPLRYQGLTTQEYREVKMREIEEIKANFDERGVKALPQLVKEYLTSRNGSELWLNIHNWSLNRPEFATAQLVKLNLYLRTLGCKFDLTLNDNLINQITQSNDRAKRLQLSQIKAAESRGTKYSLAHSTDSTNLKKIKHEIDMFRMVTSSSQSWADEDDESLPSLDDFGKFGTH